MCGRARLLTDYSEIRIQLQFDLDAPAPNYQPEWNLAPTDPMLVAIRNEDGKRIPRMMKWGLIPHWSKDGKMPGATFNARSEEFTTKNAFRDAWKWGQRCLVVTDGFYEWKKLDAKGTNKQAYAIAMTDDRPMVMAGLWAKWKNPMNGEELLSCTILTCGPNEEMAKLHDRMPVILSETDWPKWLGEILTSPDELLELLKPCPSEWIKTWAVDNKVGDWRNKGADLLVPI